jgi:hypothetical protein
MSDLPAPSVLLDAPPGGREGRSKKRQACYILTDCHDLSDTLSLPQPACIVNINTSGMTLVVRHGLQRRALLGVILRGSPEASPHLIVARVVRALAYRDGWLIACSFERPLADHELENLL